MAHLITSWAAHTPAFERQNMQAIVGLRQMLNSSSYPGNDKRAGEGVVYSADRGVYRTGPTLRPPRYPDEPCLSPMAPLSVDPFMIPGSDEAGVVCIGTLER